MTLECRFLETPFLKESLYRKEAILVFTEDADDLFFSLLARVTICINAKQGTWFYCISAHIILNIISDCTSTLGGRRKHLKGRRKNKKHK